MQFIHENKKKSVVLFFWYFVHALRRPTRFDDLLPLQLYIVVAIADVAYTARHTGETHEIKSSNETHRETNKCDVIWKWRTLKSNFREWIRIIQVNFITWLCLFKWAWMPILSCCSNIYLHISLNMTRCGCCRSPRTLTVDMTTDFFFVDKERQQQQQQPQNSPCAATSFRVPNE